MSLRAHDEGRLHDKVAIIVGAGQTPGESIGNGRATALRFAEEGARLVLVDQNLESVQETLAMAQEHGAEGYCVQADVREEAQCRAYVEAAMKHFGRIDILHNNVGIGTGDAGATSISEAAWDQIQSVNLKSVVFGCKHALTVMRAQRSGVITNISSVAAVCAIDLVAYKASKAAINAYTQSLAVSNAMYGIRANALMPGLLDTPKGIEGYVASGHDREALLEQRNRQVPLGDRLATAWDVANAALFLASDEARFITGVCLPVDGGQSARIG